MLHICLCISWGVARWSLGFFWPFYFVGKHCCVAVLKLSADAGAVMAGLDLDMFVVHEC